MRSSQTYLTLFITGDAPRSRRARANLADAMADLGIEPTLLRCIDVFQSPSDALDRGVLGTPSLIRHGSDGSTAVLYGDLSDSDKVRAFLLPLVHSEKV